ncbi:unnamed protein product [Durusdinium trenchii]|uniref:Uncharacterized protein n=1 Tax=Durusdinium trenchii TaxID=1381693 RepID=A0ABP0NDR6_9DINO
MAKTAYEPRGRAVRRFPGAGRTPRGGRPEVQAPAVMSAREVRAIPVGPEFITSITFGMEVSPRARSESLGATNASQATLRLTSSVERGAMARSARSVRSRSPSNSQSLSPWHGEHGAVVWGDEGSPRHHFLRKGAGLVSQRLVAQQNRQRGSAATGARRDVRWMERWRDGDWNDEEPVGGGTPVDWAGFGRASHSQDDEDRSASRPPLPFASDLASPAHQVVQVRRNSLRRPSVPVTIDLGLVEDGQSLSLSASAMEGSPRLPGWMVMVIDQILALREGMPNETSKFNNDSSTCAMSDAERSQLSGLSFTVGMWNGEATNLSNSSSDNSTMDDMQTTGRFSKDELQHRQRLFGAIILGSCAAVGCLAVVDGISIAIAFSCPDDTSQTLGWFMLVFYLTGVVVLQWAIMAILCFFDPSSACFAKMMHMDTFAARVTLPTEHQFTWKLLHLSRTLGEDVPQAVLQTIYLLTVTENYFMIISVCTAVCGSLLALYDAYHRALKAAGFHSKTVRVVRAVIRGSNLELRIRWWNLCRYPDKVRPTTTRDVGPSPPSFVDEPRSSLGSEETAPQEEEVKDLKSFGGFPEVSGWSQVLVWAQSKREKRTDDGSRITDWQFCGDVIYEELEEPPKPLCLPTTLCQPFGGEKGVSTASDGKGFSRRWERRRLCVQANRQDPQVRARTKRPRETNLYAVTELIIKPETCKEGVSYSELINPRGLGGAVAWGGLRRAGRRRAESLVSSSYRNECGLQVDYFISHHWAEDFGEFVQSVLRHAIIAAPELGGKWKDVVYWCCAFANNQHQIELGETLQKSPFYQALNSKNCKGTVMNLNQAATALDRIWCIYEVYLTHSLEKPFTLNFRLGPLVGVVQETKEKDSWVFHIFKMLQHIDVGQADATNPDDYNKIMGEIENFRSREGTGPKALNRIVKAMLGSQAIFTLARRGDLQAVKRALELDADPNIPDTLGIRPLTYAAGNGHEEVCHALIAGSADVRAQVGALEVLGMFSPQRGERRRCIEHVRVLDEERTEGFHSAAISKALLQHTTSRCQDLTSALDADNAELRLEVVRELRLLLHALVDHSMKLLQGGMALLGALLARRGQAGAGEDERQAISKHSQSLAPYLADPDARVRLAVVEAGGDEHRQLRSTHLEGAKEHHPGTELMGRMQVESVGRVSTRRMALCAKCRRAAPAAGDAWCLGCSGWEALGSELSFSWSHPGLRAVATDIVVSAVRQVRALRVTRVSPPVAPAARGQTRPLTPERPPPTAGAGSEPKDPRAPLVRSPRPEIPPATEEKADKDEESSYESDEDDSGEASEATIIQDPTRAVSTEGLSAEAAPAARRSAEPAEEVKQEKVENTAGEAGSVPVPTGEEAATSSRGHRHPKGEHPVRHRGRDRRGDGFKKKKRKRDKTHRAGDEAGVPGHGDDVFGVYDVRDFSRWNMFAPQPGNVLVTAVPYEVVGQDNVEGFFLVLGSTLASDASMLVQVRAIGASRDDVVPTLSSLFNRRAGALHICLNEGPCAIEEGVFHVRRLELWNGSEFPSGRLTVAGRKLLKQVLAPGGTGDEIEDALLAEDLGEVVELEGSGKERGVKDPLTKGKGGKPPGARASKRKAPGEGQKAVSGRTAPGILRDRLEKVRQKQQNQGLGRRVRIAGEDQVFEEDGDASPAPAGLTTSSEIGTTREAAGARRAGTEIAVREPREGIMKNLRLRRQQNGGVVATLTSQAAKALQDKKRRPRKKKDKALDALKVLLGGKKRKKKKKKEKKRKRGDDPDGGDSGDSSGSSGEDEKSGSCSESGDSSEEEKSLLPPLKKKSERAEGSVLELLITQIEQRLNELGVSSQTRDGRELFLIANCIDLLRVGRLGRLGDALAARWLALEQAGLDQNWSAARHLEIFSPDHATAAGPAVTLAARKFSKLMEKVTDQDSRILMDDSHVLWGVSEIKEDFQKRTVSYSGEEICKAEALSLARIKPGLPPEGHGGSIEAVKWVGGRTRELLLNPLGCLCPDVGQDLPRLQGKVHIVREEALTVAMELVRRGICRWTHSSEVVTYRGQKVLNGLFGVPKSKLLESGESVLRVIMNLVPINSVLRVIPGRVAKLPNITQWLNVVLEEGETVRLAQSDMTCAFYLFGMPIEWSRLLCFNLCFDSSTLGVEARSNSEDKWYLSCAVLPMGWSSAVGVMQEIAESVLLQGGLDDQGQIHKTCPLPSWMINSTSEGMRQGRPWWHVYLDNFAGGAKVVEEHPKELIELQRSAEALWGEAGIVVSADKSVVAAESGVELGAFIGGSGQWIGASCERMIKIIKSTLWLIHQPSISKKKLQIVMGRWCFALQFRRPGMCQFDAVWAYISSKRPRARQIEDVRCYDVAGVKVKAYLACDIHKPANRTMARRWPDTIFWDDVKTLTLDRLRELLEHVEDFEEVHVWAGFPCVDLSSVRANRLNLEGKSSGLIREAVRIFDDTKSLFPQAAFHFFVENVSSMDYSARDEISRMLGVLPYKVDPKEQVPNSRPRYCWTTMSVENLEGLHITEKPGYKEVWVAGEWPAPAQWLTPGWEQAAPEVIYPTFMKAIRTGEIFDVKFKHLLLGKENMVVLATGVDWAVEPRALRAEDAEGRNVAHLAVEKGHMECLAMMARSPSPNWSAPTNGPDERSEH